MPQRGKRPGCFRETSMKLSLGYIEVIEIIKSWISLSKLGLEVVFKKHFGLA
jgi:hypothetical protein